MNPAIKVSAIRGEPHYEWEPPEHVHRPVWLYAMEKWQDENTALSHEHDDLRSAIATYLSRRES